MNRRIGILFAAAALVALSVSAVAVAAPLDPKRVKQASRLCVKAERALKTGAMDQAGQQFAEALEVQPGLPTAHIGLGHVAMARGDHAAALENYAAARENFAAFGEVVRDAQAKRYRSARSDITAIRDQINNLQQNSSSRRAPQQIAQMQNQIAQLEVIEPPDPEGVSVPPPEYDFYIGNARFQLQDVAGAIEAWERCRDAKPKFAMVYNNLALAYWKSGRLDEAVAALEQASELEFPVNPDFKRDLEAAAAKG